MISKLIANVAVIFAALSLGIVCMIFGYGLMPKNWTVVICCSVFGQLVLATVRALMEMEDKEKR